MDANASEAARPIGNQPVPTLNELKEGVPTGYSAAVLAILDDETPLYAAQRENKKNVLVAEVESKNSIQMTKGGDVTASLHSNDANRRVKLVVNTGEQMVYAEGKKLNVQVSDDPWWKKAWDSWFASSYQRA